MKIAFHFNANHPSLSSYYGYDIQNYVFPILLKQRNLQISSKIFVGDLLLSSLASVVNGNQRHFNREKYTEVIKLWLNPENAVWSRMIYDRLQTALSQEIYVICFETIELSLVNYLHDNLLKIESYLGALAVDETIFVHWNLYSKFISPLYRFTNRAATIFWDGISNESKDESLIKELLSFGFTSVKFESLNGKYTIFDEYHNFDHAKRIAEWKQQSGSLLAFIADDVVHRLGDTAPDLSNKLWAMLDTFSKSETNEQLAQVTASCRRIIEYVSDQLFPPIDGELEGRKMGANQYRNRLLAFVDQSRKSNTNIDVVWISTKTLSEQIEKLTELTNKGVHSEVCRAETRRCLLRTIILLDDIISLKSEPFEIKPKLNFDDLFNGL